MSTYWILTDGSVAVQLYPEWDYQRAKTKIEDKHRTRNGTSYRYKWGTYDTSKFSVEFVSSADTCRINSWWGGNAVLSLYDASSIFVMSGYLGGDSQPIGQFVEPYTDQYRGVIQLEA